jgi:hypothetical protein
MDRSLEPVVLLLIGLVVLLAVLALIGFLYLKQRMAHERHMLALQKGLSIPPEAATSRLPGSVLLVWVALGVPVLLALIALGVTIWAGTRTFWINPFMRDGVILVAWLVTGWTACVFVSATAIVVSVKGFIAAARTETQRPALLANPSEAVIRKQEPL